MCNGTTTFTLKKGDSDIPLFGGLGAQDDAAMRLSGNVCFTEQEGHMEEACTLMAVRSNHP